MRERRAGALPAEGAGAGLFLFVGEVEGLALFAAVDFGLGTEAFLDLVAEEVPAFEVAGAYLAFFVLEAAGALARGALHDAGAVAEGADFNGLGDGSFGGCVFRIGHGSKRIPKPFYAEFGPSSVIS